MKKPIGYISYTHGLDGKVKIVPMILPELFKKSISSTEVFIEGTERKLNEIEIKSFDGKVFLCKFDEINSIDEAKKILKREIFIEVEESDFISGEKIIGFDVFVEDFEEQGRNIKYGKVVDFGNYGNGELVEIELVGSKKREFYRCSKDDIKDVNYNEKKILLFKRNEC